MKVRSLSLALVLLVVSFLGPVATAQWSADPAVNLAIANRAGEQTIPLVASTSDGGVYVAWFDHASGNYDVYLQRLDAAGNEQWPHNGILISNHTQDTALYGWDMIADSSDNAVLVFSDTRAGGDLDIYAYRIDPAGAFLWGPNGVTLSTNADFEPAPRVAEASDGDFVFVWFRDPSTGDADIRMQRLSPAGVPQFVAGGLPVVSETGKDPAFVSIVPSDSGGVILCWLRDIRTFLSSRHIRAGKFSSTGAALWGPLEIYNLFSVPLGYGPRMFADGSDGAVIYWHRSDGSLFNSFVQHLDKDGTELLTHNGVEVSTTAGMYHLDPTATIDTATGEIYVFWNERNTLQSQWGIYGQKLSAAGARQWGSGGIALLPVSTVFKSFPRSVPVPGGAMVFFVYQPSGVDLLAGTRVDSTGTQVWAGSPIAVSSAAGGKSRYPVTIGPDGVAKLVWEDTRNGAADIYGQNVNPSGTLGVPPSAGRVDGLLVGKSITPGNLVLTWGASCTPGSTNYGIYEGMLGTFPSHAVKDCSDDGGDLTEEITPAATDSYYLVVPRTAGSEGSYGTDSDDVERDPASPACAPSQVIAPCP